MSANPSEAGGASARSGARPCLARAVVDSLAEEPTLEAVTYDRAQQSLSVATLGRTDVAAVTDRLLEKIRRAEAEADPGSCGVLTGQHTCAECDTPLSPAELKNITIQHTDQRTTIARVTCPTAPRFWRWRELPLPRFVQRDVELTDVEEHVGEWKWQLLCAGLCALFGIAAAVVVGGGSPGVVGYGLYALAYLAGAWFAAREFWERLREQGGLDVHFLMLSVAAGAAAVGRWNEGVTLLFLFSLAGALEHFALERTHREIRALYREAPKTARRIAPDGSETEIAVERIRPGMRLRVKPGDQFPVDAEIVRGQTAADESNLTGESVPVAKGVGDVVLAGTLNLWGAVEVNVLRPAAESSLQKIIRLIREAQQQKAPAQRFTERFSATYTYVVIGASFAMFFVWWLALGLPAFVADDPARPNHTAFYRTMTLLVVSSPCALVLSIPSAVLAAIAWGARHGVLLRGGSAVEKLAEVNVVALDKTGTLTTGELRVEKVESFPPGRESEVARLAYSLEKLSNHPLARAVTRYGKQQDLTPVELSDFESVTGQGLRARFNGSEVRLGRRDWVLPPPARPHELSADADASVSEVWLATDGLLGRIVLRDDIRPQARAVLDELKRAGLRTVVLTGDRRAAAEHLQRELQPDEVRAELKPEDKVAFITALNAAGQRVAMVGDGVNDAPSLAAAHVGVAMGARGSDAALEQADVVLMHDRLENFLAAFRLSQRARAVIRQNLVISLGTVVVLVAFALAGRIPLPVGVIGHEGSTVLVVMNSLRLLFGGRRAQVTAADKPQ
ncbi:MAG: cation-translocating P-type ATPase [Verrucomicrobiae bacterium]|nr:cation-translocating P-type ATPase [Verrucomicrobiae bacterium]